MAIEFGKATEVQAARAVEIALLLAGLGGKKAAIQTARATQEQIWGAQLNTILTEESKLTAELNALGASLVTEK